MRGRPAKLRAFAPHAASVRPGTAAPGHVRDGRAREAARALATVVPKATRGRSPRTRPVRRKGPRRCRGRGAAVRPSVQGVHREAGARAPRPPPSLGVWAGLPGASVGSASPTSGGKAGEAPAPGGRERERRGQGSPPPRPAPRRGSHPAGRASTARGSRRPPAPSPRECGGPRPLAPLGVSAGPPRSSAPRPRRSRVP